MKNITEILTGLGIQIPEDKTNELNKLIGENYKTIADYDKQKQKLTQTQESLQTAQEGLKKFEGVDPAELQGRISKLTKELADKDTAHAAELADRDFQSLLDGAITEKHGRSAKAIKALLDVDALKDSKNQEQDIKAALDALAKDSGYLFESEGTPPPYAGGAGTQGGSSDFNSQLRAAFGLSADKQ